MAAVVLPPSVFQVNHVKPVRPNKIKKAKTTPPTAFTGWQRRYRWIFYVL
jgi:hypothetical protein